MDGNDDHWERRSDTKAVKSMVERHGRVLLAFRPIKRNFAWRSGKAFLLNGRERRALKDYIEKITTPLHYPDP